MSRITRVATAVTVLAVGAHSQGVSQAPDTAALRALAALDSLRRNDANLYATMRRILITDAQMALGRLGFGQLGFSGVTDSNMAVAMRRFEAARQLPITGDFFTPATFARLQSDAARVAVAEQRPFTGLKQFTWTNGWLMVEGPWVLDGEPDTFMRVKIYCARDEISYFGPGSTMGECHLWWARIGVGLFRARELMILDEHFQIDRWDQTELVCRPRDYTCVRYNLRINRLQESVVMTRSTLSRSEECAGFEGRDVVTRLADSTSLFQVNPSDTAAFSLYNLGPEARAALGLKPR